MSAENVENAGGAENARPEVHVHNKISIGGAKGWNILVTLMVVTGVVAMGYQLSLGPWAEVTATGISMFLVTLVSLMFKAGILRLPQNKSDDDLEFTKGTLRRIYDELQAAVVKSSMLRLVGFAAGQTVLFLLLRAAVAALFSALSGMWMAVGVGLVLGAAVIAQDQIWAWLRRLHAKRSGAR